ncbi:MAG: hypothetical protein OEW35_12990 [Gammaproteobacteria bacterium]|nr:hypothetical protein [Gammaproteobacteria bacterium]MDH4253924.1 hypothetical protein [Gammaproteobacteria bacterium]MDH5309349.1 hypothetical protein [Gammaproteobacteria bacterium]
MATLHLPHPNVDFRLPTYDIVMLLYLVSGAVTLPIIAGEWLAAAGLAGSGSGLPVPQWMYNVEILVMFIAAFTLMIAWLPAIYVCIRYWNRWRIVVPAVSLLVLTASLFLDHATGPELLVAEIAATVYAASAFGIGLEWFLKRRRAVQR